MSAHMGAAPPAVVHEPEVPPARDYSHSLQGDVVISGVEIGVNVLQ